jgi:hypothetical protein
MLTEPRRVVPSSVSLAARVTTLLARTFPEYIPGVVYEGFRVESLDHQEPRRMFVRWHGGTPTRPAWTHGPALGREKYKAQILELLTRDGYAVTNVPGRMDVFVSDRPYDTSGPRFAPVASDIPVTAPWLVMDLWTRAHAATADSEEEAAAKARELDRAHALTDARLVTVPELWPFLERADELLGDGMTWLHRTVEHVTRYRELAVHERIDALVDVANALRRGRDVVRSGRRVAYDAEPAVRAHWIPKADAPAVGYFPTWERSPEQDAAIAVLTAAGLVPVRYGLEVGGGGHMCEAAGFLVSVEESGLSVSSIGHSAGEQQARVPEVMRAAGWRAEPREWGDTWAVFPPAG